MTHPTSKWITIPEEDSVEHDVLSIKTSKATWFEQTKNWLNGEVEIKKLTPKESLLSVKDTAPQKESVLNLEDTLSQEEVIKHKWFWATGFVAVMIFTAILLVPDELSAEIKNLIPGNLFQSQVNNAIEDYDGINILPPFPGSEADLAQQQTSNSLNGSDSNDTANQVVQAGAQAVDVQVDPVPVQVEQTVDTTNSTPPSSTSPQNTSNPTPSSPLPTSSPSTVSSPQETSTQPNAEAQTDQDAALNAQQALIAQLNEELNAFKQQSQIQAQQLNGTQSGTLFPAANPPSVNQAAQTTQILGQNPSLNVTSLPQAQVNLNDSNNNSVQQAVNYRLNPYKVSLTPQQILAQNQGKFAPQTTAIPVKISDGLQANVLAANAQLGQMGAVPESGPMDLLWVALALGLFAGFRTLRAKV